MSEVQLTRTVPEEFQVPVEGGELAVLRWPADHPGAPVVLALHGITGNGLSWGLVADRLAGRLTLVAPRPARPGRERTRRSRARSGSACMPTTSPRWSPPSKCRRCCWRGTPWGRLRRGGRGRAPSRPGAAAAAGRRRGRLPASGRCRPGRADHRRDRPGDDPAVDDLRRPRHLPAVLQRVAAPAAFDGPWSPWIDAYIQRDLVGTEPELRSSCRLDAVRADGVGQFEPEVLSAVHRLTCPTDLLWAERGLQDEPQGLYDEQRLAAAGSGPRPGRRAAGPGNQPLQPAGRPRRCGGRGPTDCWTTTGRSIDDPSVNEAVARVAASSCALRAVPVAAEQGLDPVQPLHRRVHMDVQLPRWPDRRLPAQSK